MISESCICSRLNFISFQSNWDLGCRKSLLLPQKRITKMPEIILPTAIFLSAALNIRAEYSGPRWQVYLFKPLTTIAILLLAGSLVCADATYQQWILLGLLFSLFGDIFLMLPGDRFIPGLVSFLIAHLFYIAAFSREIVPFDSIIFLVIFFLAAGLFVAYAWRHLGKMRMPVAIYATAIASMGWLAAARWDQLQSPAALWGMIGAILFVISDTSLAFNRFVKRFRNAQLLILSTYFIAQYLIARSVAF